MNIAGDFFQIGVVVRDLERGMAHYRDLLGLGPFMRIDTHYEGRYRNWTGTFANRNAFLFASVLQETPSALSLGLH